MRKSGFTEEQIIKAKEVAISKRSSISLPKIDAPSSYTQNDALIACGFSLTNVSARWKP